MPPTLTQEQRQALDRDVPAEFVDPITNRLFVLIPKEQYEKVRELLEDNAFDVRDAYPLMDEVARKSGWDDPAMDIYNDMDPRKA